MIPLLRGTSFLIIWLLTRNHQGTSATQGWLTFLICFQFLPVTLRLFSYHYPKKSVEPHMYRHVNFRENRRASKTSLRIEF